MDKIIEIKDLWFSYNDQVILEDINFTCLKNSFWGIIGPNGAGKSTLVKLIMGMLSPDKGSIKVFGIEPKDARSMIGYIPQSSKIDITYPINVFEAVMMGRLSVNKMFRRFDSSDKKIVMEAIERTGLKDLAHNQIGKLSGGQIQKIFMARALATEAELMIFDEPFTGIDTVSERNFYEFLSELKKEKTIILISHDIGVLSNAVDKIGCLNRKLFFHDEKEKALDNLNKVYGCPVDIIAHGTPHRVLDEHGNCTDTKI